MPTFPKAPNVLPGAITGGMERLCFRAGKRAFEVIKDGGFDFGSITTYVGPGVGPRWLVASGFDLTLIETEKLGTKLKPVLLTGSSAGAWRFAAWVQPEPAKRYDQLLRAYIRFPYRKKSTPEALRGAITRVINAYVKDDAVPFALAHDRYRLAVATARARHLLASETRWVQRIGLGLGSLFNRMSAGALPLFLERVIFYNGPRPPLFCLHAAFRGRAIPLTPVNFKFALLATAAIPLVVSGIRDIYGAPTGVYRDGGLVDYHLNEHYAAGNGDVTLLFHHEEKIVPTWLDQNLKNRAPRDGVLDDLLMVYPSRSLIQKFPGGKVPDRDDFVTFVNDPRARVKIWESVVDASAPLGEIFVEAVESGRIRDLVQEI